MFTSALKVCYITLHINFSWTLKFQIFSAIDDAAREAKRISLETGSAPIPSDNPGSEEMSTLKKEVGQFQL